MVDPTQHELEAIMAAGGYGGEYLDSLGKTDLAALTEDEWLTFVECIVTGFTDKLQELESESAAPQ
jgi:hypothetical protein